MSNRHTILAPLAVLYGWGLRVRHGLYDRGILKEYVPPVPTICIGNLAVGGTGKTPHVEWLVRELMRDYRVAVLSRGYGRSTRGFVLADDAATAATIGDEAMQLHAHLPRLTVAVSENRPEGVKRLLEHDPSIQVILLDDAMQHRAIRAGYTLLLTRLQSLYTEDRLLPWGRLRDLVTRAKTADMVIVTGCPETMTEAERTALRSRLRLARGQMIACSHLVYPLLPFARVLLVTGIAHPEGLIQEVQKQTKQVTTRCFGDHHRFTDSETDDIARLAQDYDYVLTTEKDMARLALTRLPEQLGDKLQTIPICVEPDAHVLTQIQDYIQRALALKNIG